MLVTLEGIDGSGKSTVARLVAQQLEAAGVRVRSTAEPTSTWMGKAVRRAIAEDSDPVAVAFLFMADRASHVRQIKEWQAQGYVVLCDRFADSTIAYQSVALADRMDDAPQWLSRMQWRLVDKPWTTLWLDVQPEQALQRIAGRAHRESFEQVVFLRSVRDAYSEMAAQEPQRWLRLDAAHPVEHVAAAATEALLARLPAAAADGQ